MKIDVFEPISLCSGVESSISMIEEARKNYPNKDIFCLGHPVHSEIISNSLKKLGIKIIEAPLSSYEDEISKLPDGCVVVFSAHGHDKSLDDLCKTKKITIIDTTCPIVKNVDSQIKNLILNKNKKVIYIGKENHAESYAVIKNNPLVDFWEISSSFLVDFQYIDGVVLNQTTILKEKLEPHYSQILRENEQIIVKNTSCHYVNLRYLKLKKLDSFFYDYVIIIGSSTSSNTTELFEKAIEWHGKEKALLVSKAEDIQFMKDLEHKPESVALFSGTSAPRELIDSIIEALNSL